LRFGLGSFSFTPTQAGAAYKAIIKLANQQTITCNLPPVREQGYVLHLEDAGPEQLRVVVQARGASLATERVLLLGHARQQVAVAEAKQLQSGQAVFTVPRQQLAAGVSHFTLFNSRHQPVCERLYFRRPGLALPIKAQTDKPSYAAREKVSLQVAAAGLQPASLSVAVYQLDSLSAAGGANIGSYLWLTADVKGPVENPDYYLTSTEPQAAEAADNLMLTQGWSRFSWKNVLSTRPDSLAYSPELHGQLLRGRVVNSRTGAPAAGVPVYLTVPSRLIRLYNTVSKPDGSFLIEVPDWYGTKQFVALTNPRQDSLYRVEVFSPFSPPVATKQLPSPAFSEELAAGLLRRHVQMQVQQQYARTSPVLYQLPPTDSIAFFGTPREHYVLDNYTRFKTIEDVLREYVPGVLVRNSRQEGYSLLVPNYSGIHSVMDKPLVLLDGVPVFNTNQIMAFDPLRIQGLDVVTHRYIIGAVTHNGIISFKTYKGDLAGFPLDAKALLQEYEGLQGKREFYAPRYDTPAAKHSRLPDFRNLLYWNPQVSTTAEAPSELSFYTSDQVGKYRVVVQGLASNGQAGSASFTMEVKAAP
jgi:hypothetical protein